MESSLHRAVERVFAHYDLNLDDWLIAARQSGKTWAEMDDFIKSKGMHVSRNTLKAWIKDIESSIAA